MRYVADSHAAQRCSREIARTFTVIPMMNGFQSNNPVRTSRLGNRVLDIRSEGRVISFLGLTQG
jgi:hypothetical protein